jgi:hypothetical protein
MLSGGGRPGAAAPPAATWNENNRRSRDLSSLPGERVSGPQSTAPTTTRRGTAVPPTASHGRRTSATTVATMQRQRG